MLGHYVQLEQWDRTDNPVPNTCRKFSIYKFNAKINGKIGIAQ